MGVSVCWNRNCLYIYSHESIIRGIDFTLLIWKRCWKYILDERHIRYPVLTDTGEYMWHIVIPLRPRFTGMKYESDDKN